MLCLKVQKYLVPSDAKKRKAILITAKIVRKLEA